MAKIAFLLLCHRDPEAVIRQAESLTAAGDCMAIHFDARAPAADYARIRTALADNPDVVFTRTRIRCGWGEWSLVQATLQALRAARDSFADATHFYLISADCAPIKTAEHAHELLDARACDHIESHDFFTSDWIRTGWREERLRYRHWFNERRSRRLFYAMFEVQKRLGLTRALPEGLHIKIGSQWWCLRRDTVAKVLDFIATRPDVVAFFRLTWVPDESFFQTLVRHLVPAAEIENRPLTFLMFSDYGMPVTFHNDHHDLLLSQSELFARKISPNAHDLQDRLGRLWSVRGHRFVVSDEGRALYGFLTGKGREGRRFAPRFWEAGSTVGRDREMLIVLCKKWDIGKRLVGRVRSATGLTCLDYVFNEEACPLPDLGGLEHHIGKRHRHRRALLRLLFDHFETDRLLFCLDPAELDMLRDFAADQAGLRTLEIACRHSDAWLAGHARRTGLATQTTPAQTLERLLPTLRNGIMHESDRIRDARFPGFQRMTEGAPMAGNARALAAFLRVDTAQAHAIIENDDFFAD